jgi:hypothetical protein
MLLWIRAELATSSSFAGKVRGTIDRSGDQIKSSQCNHVFKHGASMPVAQSPVRPAKESEEDGRSFLMA